MTHITLADPVVIHRQAYSPAEAAAMLGLERTSIYRLIQRGKLRCLDTGLRKTLIPASEIHRLLKSSAPTA